MSSLSLENSNLKLIAPNRINSTSATEIYNPSNYAVIDKFFVANVTNVAVSYSIYVDVDGTTYDQSTALFYQINLPANSTEVIVENFPVNAGTSIAVQSSTANSITYTLVVKEKII